MAEFKKPVLAVDVDEVLAYFIPSLVEFHNESYSTTLSPESFFSYEFHEVWGGGPADCLVKLDIFFESRYFNEDLMPLPSAYEALLKLKQHFDLHVVTSRQNKVKNITFQWIERHFPDIFSEIHLANHYSREGKSRTKSEICHSIGACLLIDDSAKYAIQCVHDNIPVLLFGQYGWNQWGSDRVPQDIKFIQYDSSVVINESNSMLNKISSDVNSAIIDKFNLKVNPTSDSYYVYRVNSWSEIERLIYSYFGLSN